MTNLFSTRRSLMLAAILSVYNVPAALAQTQTPKISDDVVRIGVLTDLSGLYSDLSGMGSVLAARLAVEDFGKSVHGKPIEIISSDTLNKPDVASSRARTWYDREGVDYIVDMPSSSVSLAVAQVAKSKGKMAAVVGGASTRLTNEECAPTVLHWAYDTYALATATAKAVVEDGGKTWYFMVADYAGGHALHSDAEAVVLQNGGKVVGKAMHPFAGSDFSSFLVQASASGAQVIGLANAGGDTVNSIKQAAEFGINKKHIMATTLLFDTDVHSIGLKNAQGIYLATGFYWDYDEKTRAFGKRFFEKHKRMPTMVQAGVYSAVLHYLKGVKAAGTDDAMPVVQAMQKLPVEDLFARNGKLREDGRMVHDMYLAQVKAPEASKYPWDYFTIKKVISGEDAYQPLSKSRCAHVKK